LTPPCVFAQANAAIANAVDGFFAAGILDLVGDPTAGTSGAAPQGGGGGGGATANQSGPAKSAPSGGAVDGFPNETTPCPPGCEFYEEIDGHTYQWCRWVKVGQVTKAVMLHKKEDDPDLAYFFAPATAKDTKSLTNLLAPTFKRHKDDAARRGKSKQVQHSFAAGEGFFDGIIDFAKKGKAMMREGAEDAAELNALVGGDGVVPAVTLPADSSTVCAICHEGPDDGKPVLPGSSSITLKCGHAFHAACWHKHSYSAHPSSRTCPVCRDPLAAPAAAAADPGSESGGNTCSVCGRSDETGDDWLINCSHDACGYWIHLNCNKITIPNAALEDESSTAPQFFCPVHHHRCVRGDFKLEPDTAHLAVQAGRNIQSATQPAARAARLQARTVTAPAASGGCNMSWQELAQILIQRCSEKGANMPALMSDAVWPAGDWKKIIDRLIQELNKLQPAKETSMKRKGAHASVKPDIARNKAPRVAVV